MEWIQVLKSLDYNVIGCSIAVIGFVYGFFRNFKEDINKRFSSIEKQMDATNFKINSLEERMFLLSTGKTLAQAILEEKLKNNDKGD